MKYLFKFLFALSLYGVFFLCHPQAFCDKKPKKIEAIATRDGHYYSNIKALIPKDDVLIIITKKGEYKVDYRKLPQDIQKRYKYNPAKAEAARQLKLEKQKKEHELSKRKIERFKAKYKAIVEDGKLYVVIKKFTLAKKYGGFIHIKKNQVLPVIQELTAIRGELFSLNMKHLTPMYSYIKELESKQQLLKKEIVSLPKEIEHLQKLQSETTEKIASLLAAAKQFTPVTGTNGTTQMVRYDPVVMKQVSAIKKQLKIIKKQLRALNKKDPKDMKAEIDDLNLTLARIEKYSHPYVVKRRLRQEKKNLPTKADSKQNEPQKQSKKSAKMETIKARLKALKEMYKAELITKEEYKKKKLDLLKDL